MKNACMKATAGYNVPVKLELLKGAVLLEKRQVRDEHRSVSPKENI